MEYTESNEWISLDNNIATIGITEALKKELGEIVYIELPKLGMHVKAKEEICLIESNKSAIDIYSPIDGTVVGINETLLQDLSYLNSSPEKEGWLFKIKLLNN